MSNTPSIHPEVRIGHVHLKVADLDRALAFYCGVLGFQLTQFYGRAAAFISAGGYHHHIGLNTWESLGGSPPPRGSTGLYHLAILYPTRAELADALLRLMRASISLDGASDHGVSEALYPHDPDGDGVELYWDRPAKSGRERPMAQRKCSRARSISTICSLKHSLEAATSVYKFPFLELFPVYVLLSTVAERL
jgi:catechol 2,3-dioxygenase